MASLQLSEFVALVLGAGGPSEQLARVRWPFHKAMHELHESAGWAGERSLLGVEMVFRKSPEVGQELIGGDRALDELLRGGVLVSRGRLRQACLVVDPEAAVILRREFMKLPATQAALLQRGATRWAAMAATAAKNRSTPSRSSGSSVLSSTPNRA
jgi:hypothetical protein